MTIAKRDIFVRVVYGQGGKGPFSYGFIRFASRLRSMGYAVADDTLWKHPQIIANGFDEDDRYPVKVMLGYSMGASCIPWTAQYLKHPIDLAVGYDPSIWAASNPPIDQKKIKRVICYQSVFGIIPVGHARLYGAHVENYRTWTDHAIVPYNESLHQMTLAALARLEK